MALACVACGHRATDAASYAVSDLGDQFIPLAINDVGQIAGEGSISGPASAFLLEAGGLTPILSPAGGEVRASAINNLGQVVGANRDATGYDHAYAWDKTSGWRSLQEPDGHGSWANDINDDGIIVGSVLDGAALWQKDGRVVSLGGLYGSAFAVNSAGDIAGLASLDPVGMEQHAFIWHGGAMRDLGVTSTITKGFQDYAIGRDINDRGQVVGRALALGAVGTHDESDNGFVWDKTNGLQALVPNVNFFGINNAGQAVGVAINDGQIGAGWNAVLYKNGTMYNLNDLIAPTDAFLLMEATGINEAGQIVAWGMVNIPDAPGLYVHGYLLTPLAEPAAIWAAAIALAIGCCLMRLRRR
jgi:probable HAF family extracellular repeat protein